MSQDGVCRRLDAELRSQLSTQIIALFTHWELPKSQQYTLLGLLLDRPVIPEGLRQGEPLADDTDTLDRVRILLRTHKSLRILFPRNQDLAYCWMSTPNRPSVTILRWRLLNSAAC